MGEFKLYATVVVAEMPDKTTKMIGVTNYSTQVHSVSTICENLKSEDPEWTLKHESDHAWRDVVGLMHNGWVIIMIALQGRAEFKLAAIQSY
jgi:hypothetical protein